jgi:hypothetical protein
MLIANIFLQLFKFKPYKDLQLVYIHTHTHTHTHTHLQIQHFLFFSTGAWTQGLHLEPLHQPYFCEGLFKRGSRETTCPGWVWTAIFLIAASWIARITGMDHQRPAYPAFSNSWINWFHLLFQHFIYYFTLLLPT